MEVANVGGSDAGIRDAAAALASGRMILLLDRAEEPGGGHLVAAAQIVSPQTIATMLREAVGMPWMALPADRCDALGLEPMGDPSQVDERDMMVTFEARHGVTTGISAADRALSMRVGADTGSTGADIVTPGHVLPVRVSVTGRPTSWTAAEAAIELSGIARMPGGAVLCQAMDEDGRPAREPDLRRLAERLEIPLVDALDLLDLRLRRSTLIERDRGERTIESPVGPLRCVTYKDPDHSAPHLALVIGDVGGGEPTRVEAFTQDIAADVFGASGTPSRDQLHDALVALCRADRGVLLYLSPSPRPDRNQGEQYLSSTIRSHLVTQILRDLGVATIQAGDSS